MYINLKSIYLEVFLNNKHISLENEEILSHKIQLMDALVPNCLSNIPETHIDTTVLSVLLPQVKMMFEEVCRLLLFIYTFC